MKYSIELLILLVLGYEVYSILFAGWISNYNYAIIDSITINIE